MGPFSSKISSIVILLCCSFATFAGKPSSIYETDIQQEPSAIKIIVNNWTSQIVLSHITGKIFQHLGYDVEYIPTSTSDQWGALAYGVAHVQVEVWQGTMAESFNRHVVAGSIVDAGAHTATTREDWWYPEYVEQECPGLPSWQALRDCAQIFSRPNSNSRGVYYAGPWEKPDAARIRALNLNFDIVILSAGDELWLELEKAIKNKQPIVLFNWSPNWVESRIPGRFIEFPDYDIACEQDPNWGVNKSFLYDCGNPKGGWLKKASAKGMEKQFPCAFNALKNISFTNQQLSHISALVDVDKMTYEDAATQWLNENKHSWQKWLPLGCDNE